jgi:hypothetical protein
LQKERCTTEKLLLSAVSASAEVEVRSKADNADKEITWVTNIQIKKLVP